MIGATLVFFPPEWPRRLPRLEPLKAGQQRLTVPTPASKQKLIAAALILYAAFSLLVPFRHWLYPGNVLWTEEGHLFAWNMMLRTKVTGIQVLAVDPQKQALEYVDVMQWLTPRQFEEMTHDPEMMREFADFVGRQYEAMGRRDIEVHFLALSSLNGRKPQLLVDPTVDLSRQPRTLWHKPWIVPLAEPFRVKPWTIPLSQWHEHVDFTLRPESLSPDDSRQN
jgi:hypothetical protein